MVQCAPRVIRGRILQCAFLLIGTTALWPGASALSESPGQGSLLEQFSQPPQSARPRLWWHWINGNITKDGLRKDLAWMKRSGIGGVQIFDVSLDTPQIVPNRLIYMQPEWKDAFRMAVDLADQQGMEVAVASSPGWSETGGPWVKPEDGLKKLVWSELTITGGKAFRGKLAAPSSVTGPFQGLPKPKLGPSQPQAAGNPVYYKDVAVLAYPLDAKRDLPTPRVLSADGGTIDAGVLEDDDLQSGIRLPDKIDANTIVAKIYYPKPVTVRSATIFIPEARGILGGGGYDMRLEAERPDRSWQLVADLPTDAVPTTTSFGAVTASRFRLSLTPIAPVPPPGDPQPGLDMSGLGALMAILAPAGKQLTELRLSAEARIDRFETKAGFSVSPDYFALNKGRADAPGIDPAKVINLTARLRPDGSLDWTPPKGQWRVVRIGASLIGTTNHPATAETTGLEVDKMDGDAVRRYLETYLSNLKGAVGPDLMGKKGISALLNDSTEIGAFNWTPRMVDQFIRLRGYDPTAYLLAMTGVIVGSRATSDRFLYDYRRTIADLHASEHYGTIAEVAHENGLKVYGEALESGRPSLGDDMAMRSYADIPMSAMWTFPRDGAPANTYVADVKGAASVAHFYGRKYVAAESMTSIAAPWAYSPKDLRRIIDFEFAMGVNRAVIHSSVHQPVDDKQPGLSLLVFGQQFNRHESWADMARPWIDYIARTSFLLQQGRNVADVAYFYGEEAPITGLFGNKPIAGSPRNFAYDFVNADALGKLTVDKGQLVAPSGGRYRILYLGGSASYMTLASLQRLATLVDSGATVVGLAPSGSPSLGDSPEEYFALVKKLWPDGVDAAVGKGRVVATTDVDGAMQRIGVRPDFAYEKSQSDSELLYVHRKLDDGDAYFVVNRRNRAEHTEARFRVQGRMPELWHADTASVTPASYRLEGDETVVTLNLAAEESVFIMFCKPAPAQSSTSKTPVLVPLITLDRDWDVSFQPGRGAPPTTRLSVLASLSDNADPRVQHFSGVATYSKSFVLSTDNLKSQPLYLDLGEVGDLAEVDVNGQPAGIVWHAPYRLDVARLLLPGRNRIEVRVANLWVNRLIGDAKAGGEPISWTSLPTYNKDAPLRPSGLVGPVRVLHNE